MIPGSPGDHDRRVLPERYAKRLQQTTDRQRANDAIRHWERVIRTFPNREASFASLGELLLEIHAKGTSARQHLDREEYDA